MSQHVLGYVEKDTPIHRLHATCKLIYFLVITTVVMLTYDTRLLLAITISSLFILYLADIHYREISFILKFIAFFTLLNLIAVYIFEPEYGVALYGSRWVIAEGWGRYSITWQQIFYESNLLLKYLATVPIAIVFIMTTNPSQFASSLNQIGLSYRISYSVALTLRYIPDIQSQFRTIRQAQEARGLDLSRKAKLKDRIMGTVGLIMPLVLTSLENIDTISHAMELRRFGQGKKRTWYVQAPFKRVDVGILVLAGAWILALILCYVANQGRFYNPFM